MIQILERMDVLLIGSIFRYYFGLNLPLRHNSVRKFFLSACYIRSDKVSLREMNEKFPFGGFIGYGNSYLDSILCYSKVFRLPAILQDVTGAVRSHTFKGPGYCYMIGRGPISCLLGHVAGL